MDQKLLHRLFDHSPAPAPDTAESQASGGGVDAQFRLGLKFANGDGSPQDYGQAAKWYLKAAEQDHALAQFNLGIMYASGHGVSRDDDEADMWFTRAARQGDPGAQHHLGMSCYRASVRGLPEAMPELRIEAYKWFILAAAQGYRGSDAARDLVVLKMSREDVTEATQRVTKFMDSIPANPPQQ